jgi:rhodanese-related sulfurtransferase
VINLKKFKELSPEELHRWTKKDTTFYLIDTLKFDIFSRSHLPNARNACIFEVTFVDQVKSIADDINSEIVLYGASNRSLDAITAAEKLEQSGYRYIYVLKGGIEAWRSAGFSLEGEAVDDPSDPQLAQVHIKEAGRGKYKDGPGIPIMHSAEIHRKPSELFYQQYLRYKRHDKEGQKRLKSNN